MVASADGAASLGGLSAGLSSDADRQVFFLLRALADVILVGAGTVRAEGYGPARRSRLWPHLRSGRTATPPIAVFSARLDLDPESRLFTEAAADARTIVITCAAAPQDLRAKLARNADVITAGEAAIDLDAAVHSLADRGHRRVLTEGGPHLLARLAAAGLLDELCLTIGPLLARPGPRADRIVTGHPFPAGPRPLTLAHVLEDSGFLLCRYTSKTPLSRTAVVSPPRQPSRPRKQPPLESGCHGGGAVVDPEFGEDVQHVGLDRGLADEQARGGLAVRAAARDQGQDVKLALAERFPGRLPDLAQQPGGDRR